MVVEGQCWRKTKVLVVEPLPSGTIIILPMRDKRKRQQILQSVLAWGPSARSDLTKYKYIRGVTPLECH
jgi:hypothetical protein